jgi:putative membrane protein
MNKLVMIGAMALLAGGPALADHHGDTGHAGKLSAQDHTFVDQAAQANHAEIALARLALQKSQSSDVKEFAQMIIDDHTKAGDQLQSITSKEDVALPQKLSAKDQAEYDRLTKLSGAAFDEEYLKSQKKMHDQAIGLFQKEARSGEQPQLKSFAEDTLPTLHKHEREAVEEQKDLQK